MAVRDIEGIRALIPLRYPYLMIDRIIEEEAKRIVALKNVTANEPFVQGHFPEPLGAVMPGTLILEAMAQTAAFLALSQEDSERQMGYLVGVDKARFRRRIVPGDQLRIEARLTRRRQGLLQAALTVSVDGETAASATISLILQGA